MSPLRIWQRANSRPKTCDRHGFFKAKTPDRYRDFSKSGFALYAVLKTHNNKIFHGMSFRFTRLIISFNGLNLATKHSFATGLSLFL